MFKLGIKNINQWNDYASVWDELGGWAEVFLYEELGAFYLFMPWSSEERHILYLVPNMYHLKPFKIPRFLFLLHTGTSIHLNTAWSIGMSAAVLVYEEWNYTIYFLRQIRFHSGMSPLLDTWNSTWNAVGDSKKNKQPYTCLFQNLHYLPSIWGELQRVKSWSNLWTYLIHTFLPV